MEKSFTTANLIIPFHLISIISLILFFFNWDKRFYLVSGYFLLASLILISIVLIYVAMKFGIKFIMELDINIFEFLLFTVAAGTFIGTSIFVDIS